MAFFKKLLKANSVSHLTIRLSKSPGLIMTKYLPWVYMWSLNFMAKDPVQASSLHSKLLPKKL